MQQRSPRGDHCSNVESIKIQMNCSIKFTGNVQQRSALLTGEKIQKGERTNSCQLSIARRIIALSKYKLWERTQISSIHKSAAESSLNTRPPQGKTHIAHSHFMMEKNMGGGCVCGGGGHVEKASGCRTADVPRAVVAFAVEQ